MIKCLFKLARRSTRLSLGLTTVVYLSQSEDKTIGNPEQTRKIVSEDNPKTLTHALMPSYSIFVLLLILSEKT